eukprot:RCo016433
MGSQGSKSRTNLSSAPSEHRRKTPKGKHQTPTRKAAQEKPREAQPEQPAVSDEQMQNLLALREWLRTHRNEVDLIRISASESILVPHCAGEEGAQPSSSGHSSSHNASAIDPSKFETFDDENAEECQICLEDGAVDCKFRRLPCGHFFHAQCIDIWLLKSSACPTCSADLTPKLPPLPALPRGSSAVARVIRA